MKKWVVPNEKGDGYDLKASRTRPPDAVAEAPDSFTRQMAPYFVVREVENKDGRKYFHVEVDPKYSAELKAREDELSRAGYVAADKLVRAAAQIKSKQKFNNMNPIQRFFKSIFGDYADEAQFFLFKQLFAVIFKKAAEENAKGLNK